MPGPLEDLKIKLEDLGLSGDQIDQALADYHQKTDDWKNIPANDRIVYLERNYDMAEDWREKARIRAQIMSEKLDL